MPADTEGRGGLIDGVAVAKKIRARVAEEAAALAAQGIDAGAHRGARGRRPGERGVRAAPRSGRAIEVGMHGPRPSVSRRPRRRGRTARVRRHGSTPIRSVHGILVQMPLPKHIDADAVIRRIDPEKDVDGFHPVNVGKLLDRRAKEGFAPCTPAGVMDMLRAYGVETRGADVRRRSGGATSSASRWRRCWSRRAPTPTPPSRSATRARATSAATRAAPTS